jgi:hypothetical protein
VPKRRRSGARSFVRCSGLSTPDAGGDTRSRRGTNQAKGEALVGHLQQQDKLITIRGSIINLVRNWNYVA